MKEHDEEVLKKTMKSILDFVVEMKEGNDRAVVIVGAANVDSLLGQLIQRSLLPPLNKTRDELLNGDSPLSTFSARINMCYRFLLIDKELCQTLHILRRIRNDFAHKIKECDLSSSPHSDQVKELIKYFKDEPLLDKLRPYFVGDDKGSRDFRIIVSLISGLLEIKINSLPKMVKGNPASISWIPKDVNL